MPFSFRGGLLSRGDSLEGSIKDSHVVTETLTLMQTRRIKIPTKISLTLGALTSNLIEPAF
ncbi:MAG: hypothetical protein F6K58_24095 [Symploca sp. SIO2E9]|nr:hypothetical protein [Symploca sp. SIO2E9]